MRGALVLLLCTVGCGEGVLELDVPFGNPLVPEVRVYPFPSDFYLTADDSSPTGRRGARAPSPSA